MLFVSYAHGDRKATGTVTEKLLAAAVDFWLDDSMIPIGEAFVAHLGAALRGATDFLLVDSPMSRSSYWVKREVRAAVRLRGQGSLRSLYRVSMGEEVDAQWEAYFDASFPLRSVGSDIASALGASGSPLGVPLNPGPLAIAPLTHGEADPPVNWFGRQDSLALLDDCWFGESGLCWISGMGGMGKSSLAKTWATALVQLGYETPDRVAAGHAGIRDVVSDDPAIVTWLRDHSDYQRLLILDGFDESTDARTATESMLKQANIAPNVRLLVSSRQAPPQPLDSDAFHLRLDRMSSTNARDLVQSAGASGDVAVEIADALGGLPLALQMATQLLRSGRDPHRLLQELRRSFAELSEDGSVEGRHSLTKSIELTFNSLPGNVQTTLVQLAHRADEPMDLTMESPITGLRGDLQHLAKMALVTIDDYDSPTTVSIHPIVRQWVLELDRAADA